MLKKKKPKSPVRKKRRGGALCGTECILPQMELRSIRSGEFDVIANGSLMAFKDEPISMEFLMDQGVVTTIRFIFETDPENKETRINGQAIDNGTNLEIKLINLPEAEGGTSVPVEIGDENGRKVYVALRSAKVGDTRTLSYTFFKHRE